MARLRLILLVILLAASAIPGGMAGAAQGFVGTLAVTPERGPVGTRVTLTGAGLPASATLSVVWTTVDAGWDLEHRNGQYIGIFNGRTYREVRRPLAAVTTDADGKFTAALKIPEDYGGVRDIYLMHGDRVLTKTGFRILPQASLSPASGPLGTPIRIKLTGLDPVQPLETWYWVLYDNRLTGYVTAVRTKGTARFNIPATGDPGLHVIDLQTGAPGAPYRAKSTSPLKYIPIFRFAFNLTPGEAILPPPPEAQMAKPLPGIEPPLASPVLWSDPRSGPVGAPARMQGKGFVPGDQVELLFYNMKGSRVSESGFEPYVERMTTVTVGTDGRFEWAYKIPDHLGGFHQIAARVRGREIASTALTVDRTPLPLSAREVRVGEEITVHLKGVGWTETENIFAIVYDNSYIGYACGFNSDGDVIVKISATGAPGWHYIDLYPTFYRLKDYSKTLEVPFLFRHAMLSWQDHPQPFVFRYAFTIVK
ncbi:MAG: hypothetical protein HY660_18500 [Armatimonadetes bacterium]|nr:hypothetical protein [Armatimonadota bacterium]